MPPAFKKNPLTCKLIKRHSIQGEGLGYTLWHGYTTMGIKKINLRANTSRWIPTFLFWLVVLIPRMLKFIIFLINKIRIATSICWYLVSVCRLLKGTIKSTFTFTIVTTTTIKVIVTFYDIYIYFFLSFLLITFLRIKLDRSNLKMKKLKVASTFFFASKMFYKDSQISF